MLEAYISRAYLRYLYFNTGPSCLPADKRIKAYVFLAPAIVGRMITLGVMQQIIALSVELKVLCNIY